MERIGNAKKIFYTACVFLSMWVLSATHAAMGYLNTSVIDFYSLDGALKGLPGSINTVLSMIAFMLVILMIGRIRKPLIVLVGALGSAAALITLTGTFPFPVFIFLIGLSGFACGCIDSVASASMSDLYTGKKGAQMMCALHAVYGLAGFFMPFAYGWVVKNAGRFQMAYLPLGVVCIVLSALMLLVTKGKFRDFEAADADGMRFSASALKRLFSNKSVVPMIVILFMLGMYFNGVLDWGRRFMDMKYQKYEAVVVSCLYFSIAVSRLVMSFVRTDTLKFTRIALFVSFVFLALASFMGNASLSLAFMIVSMLACGPIIPIVLSMACEVAPKDRFLASGVLLLFHFLGKTIYAPFFGAVESSMGISWGMMFTSLSALLACLAALLIPKKDVAK
ncbi:MAG: MFS transporter [Clostridia bacterium]|nr:MFS transporter [Clostridia bacterium]